MVSSWRKGHLKGVARHGDTGIAVALAAICSLLHHHCFVSGDVIASSLIYLVVFILLVKELGRKSAAHL